MKKNSFDNLDFKGFQKLASDPRLSKYEKIGFPDHYRAGYEERIFQDICSKLTNLNAPRKRVLDIGPGCSDLPHMLLELCEKNSHEVTLLDSQEMLDHLPDSKLARKIAGLFPNCADKLKSQRFDVILCYSVLQYIAVDSSVSEFIDASLDLLDSGGQFLIGDIPNVSKRRRFFSSEAGIQFHRNFTKDNSLPELEPKGNENTKIDDGVILSILEQARNRGCDAYVLPQGEKLPMANRREDILICRP